MMSSLKDYKNAIKMQNHSGQNISLALLGDSATQFLATSLKGELVLRYYNPLLWEAEYNQVEQQVLNPESDFYHCRVDYTIVFQSTHKLLEYYNKLDISKWTSLANTRLDFIRTLCSLVKGRIIYYNYPEIEDVVFGSYANKLSMSFSYQVRKLNYELMKLACQIPNLYICDLSGIQNKYGRDFLFDSSIYTNTEMLLSIDALPLVAKRTVDIIASLEGKSKKCIILDLDNTIWGGVVGDDGWEGIQLGHGLGIGKAYTEFQQWIKKLKNRGIILAVCSKNDENKAKEPFIKNPEMVLHLDDIAVFVANWENKVDNIRTIQGILNIGFDSMVFLDDNAFERNMVRENIPGITVPELPEDPSDYLEYLYSLNLFETTSFSFTDTDRTKQYQIETQRVSFHKNFLNEADFLKSLEMRSEVRGFDKFNSPRVSQLTQRSNQFNLRTIRYTEAEIDSINNNNNYIPFSFTLTDKFGDNGLICVVILEKKDQNTLFVNTWLMSCRVLKRGMENFTLNTIIEYAQNNGYSKIIGEYLPTPKNQIVKEHYPNLGFKKIEDADTDQFELEVKDYKNRECYITKK